MAFTVLTIMRLVKRLQSVDFPPDSFQLGSGGFSEDEEWTTLHLKVRRQVALQLEEALAAEGLHLRPQSPPATEQDQP